MLLIRYFLLMLTVATLWMGTAQAEDLPGLTAGTFVLRLGEEALCPDFTVAENYLNAPKILIAGKYTFLPNDSEQTLPSDLDPNCEFRQRTMRTTSGEATELIRINAEYCGQGRKEMRSETNTRAVFLGQEIRLTYTSRDAQGPVSYDCVWTHKASPQVPVQ